jgi:outer membrane biosynthesis protein TonB
MELRTIIRTDIAASAIAHLTLVALIIVISEVRPFHSQPPETVTVDLVTPEQVKQEETKAEEKKDEAKPPEPPPDLKLPKPDVTDKTEASKPAAKPQAPAPSASPSQQTSPEPQQKQPQPSQAAKQREANAQPPQPPPVAPPPAYQAPQPDVTIRYGVMLGLPPELPVEPKGAKDDGGDANDSIAAKLPPEIIAELRRHLRACAKLPAGVAPTDNVHVRLRTVFATDGTLAREPILIAAPPSAKGVAIVKSAMSALQNCQPYKMLPANLYGEWKVLDLPFSPKDFGG